MNTETSSARAATAGKSAISSPLDTTPPGAVVPDANGVLTRQEVAEHLKISVRTVEEWQRKGILPFIKVGKIVLFHWPDVVEHLRRNFRVCRRHFSVGTRPQNGGGR